MDGLLIFFAIISVILLGIFTILVILTSWISSYIRRQICSSNSNSSCSCSRL